MCLGLERIGWNGEKLVARTSGLVDRFGCRVPKLIIP